MVFGRKKEASDEAEPWTRVTPPRPHVDGQFRQPTDVTWDTQGNIFISDGYINSRVAKFDKNGDWVKSWGEPGSQAGRVRTRRTASRRTRKGNIYVADRGQPANPGVRSERQVPAGDEASTSRCPPTRGLRWGNHADGRDRGYPAMPGAPWAVCITPGPNQVLYASDAYPGRIYKLSLDGKDPRRARQGGEAAETVRLDSRDRVPVRERAVRRGAAQLARAEADAASRHAADGEPLTHECNHEAGRRVGEDLKTLPYRSWM